jgi:uncharacterized membrane protein
MLFGFFTYMTFDLTSLSVMKDWHWQIAIIDIFWGMILSGSVSIITYIFCKKFLNL